MQKLPNRPSPALRWAPFALLPIALLAAALLALAACSNSDSTNGQPAATALPTPTPTPIDVPALLAASGERMAGLQSFGFRVTHEGGGTDLGGSLGLVVEGVEGSAGQPDKLHVDIAGSVRGLPVDMKLITIGEEVWLSDPFTERWSSIDDAVNPFAFFDPQGGIVDIMANVRQASYVGLDAVDGASAHRIRGTLPAQVLSSFLGIALSDGILDAAVWLGTDSLYLRRVELQGLLVPGEEPGILRIIELDAFNGPVDIQPPV